MKMQNVQQFWDRITQEYKNVTFGDYHDVYLPTDLSLLAYLFEAFQNTYLENYKLHPAHFYIAATLAWQAFLAAAAEYCEHELKHKDYALCLDEFEP